MTSNNGQLTPEVRDRGITAELFYSLGVGRPGWRIQVGSGRVSAEQCNGANESICLETGLPWKCLRL